MKKFAALLRVSFRGMLLTANPTRKNRKKAATGAGFSIVCPGIRPGGSVGDDQQRTVGVAQAFADGADAIVVGRPIRLAPGPRAAALAMQREIISVFNKNQ